MFELSRRVVPSTDLVTLQLHTPGQRTFHGQIRRPVRPAATVPAGGQIRDGVLLLDEIGEMPLSAQARLLKVLQEWEVTPLGSTESFPVDIRLISATNQHLRAQLQTGQFRADLYYRLSGLSIELPPLRARVDKRDLFRRVHARYRDSTQHPELSEALLELFEQHPWPGNIRQLINVLQVALAMADSGPLETWHLPDDFVDDVQAARPLPAGGTNGADIQVRVED